VIAGSQFVAPLLLYQSGLKQLKSGSVCGISIFIGGLHVSK